MHTATSSNARTVEGVTFTKTSSYQNLEALTHDIVNDVYTGLQNYLAGDKLAAFRFIQIHALEKLMQFIERTTDCSSFVTNDSGSAFSFASRYPDYAPWLRSMMLGPDETPHAAESILAFMHDNWPLSGIEENAARQLLLQTQK